MRRGSKTVAGIDLGSSKITSVIADVTPDEVLIRGINTAPSKSIVKGVIRDLNQCASEIDASFSGAVYSSGVHIDQVHLAFNCDTCPPTVDRPGVTPEDIVGNPGKHTRGHPQAVVRAGIVEVIELTVNEELRERSLKAGES